MATRSSAVILLVVVISTASSTIGGDAMPSVTALRPELSLAEVERTFKSPPNEFRIVQYGLSRGTLRKYPQYGIGGTMAFLYGEMYRQGTKGPERINPLIEKARDTGYKVWLADDWGYPSGMAGGRVVEQHPEVELHSLVMVTKSGTGKTPIDLVLPDDLTDVVATVLYPLRDGVPGYSRAAILETQGRKVTGTGLDGDWMLSVFARFRRTRNTQAQSTMAQFKHTGRFPDLMNDRAVASFIENMHGAIMAQIKNPQGVIQGFYANEPNLMQTCWQKPGPYACLPWTTALPTEFKAMHGYELTPYLAACFDGDELTARRTRIHFRQTVTRLFARSFGRQIADWCEKRGIRSSGHFLLNEYLSQHVVGYGDMMKFVSEFHVPALDIPIPNPDQYASFPYEQTRFFSSVALWKERPDTIMLLDPIIGGYGRRRLSPALPLLINSVNHAFYHGATIFTSYLPLNRNQSGTAAGYKPEEFRFLNEYIGRLGMLIRGAKPTSQIALYYPITQFQAHVLPSNQRWPQIAKLHRKAQQAWDETQRALRDAGMEYTIVHPEAVSGAPVKDGTFAVGSARFRYLIVPHMEFIPLAALKTIRALEKAGGTVIWVGTVPRHAERAENTAAVHRLTDGCSASSLEKFTRSITNPYPSEVGLRFLNKPQELLVGRFLRGTTPLYLAVNKTGERIQIRAQADDAAPPVVKIHDPSTGTTRSSPLREPIWLEGHRSLVITQ